MITAVCKHDCGWRIHATRVQGESTFQIKTLREPHKCGKRVYNNHLVTSTYLATYYLEKLRDNPDWDVKVMKKAIRRKFGVDVTLNQCYTAGLTAMKIIDGDVKKQYESLRDYAATVLKYNPGSVIRILSPLDEINGKPRFKRIYVRYAAQMNGFLTGCRPIVGLDGCFLKGFYTGQILSAVGRDGNDNMFPVAFAVVEGENYSSWSWFFEQLINDFGREHVMNWTYISDRQKGLVEVFNDLLPEADHRFCVRHLYCNFKNKFKGLDLKELLWKAATTGSIKKWEQIMKKIKDDYSNMPIGNEAEEVTQAEEGSSQRRRKKLTTYEYLSAIDPKLWTRSHMNERSKCDVLVNNLSESFNACILEARDKPIVSMLEWIRRKLMNRLQVKRNGIEKFEGKLCPNVYKKLEKYTKLSSNCFASWSGDLKFEVDFFDTQNSVDLEAKTCTCRLWQLSGLPCKHAISCIQYNRQQPEEYVHPCYLKEYVVKAYEGLIYPVPGKHEWESIGGELIQAPNTKKQIGRPNKVRKRSNDEPRPGQASSKPKDPDPNVVTRKGKYIVCRKCLQKNHNVKTCPNEFHPNSVLLKKKNITTEGDNEAETSSKKASKKSKSKKGNNNEIAGTTEGATTIAPQPQATNAPESQLVAGKRKVTSYKSSTQPRKQQKMTANEANTSISQPLSALWDQPSIVEPPQPRIPVSSQESFWTNAGKLSAVSKRNIWKPPRVTEGGAGCGSGDVNQNKTNVVAANQVGRAPSYKKHKGPLNFAK